MLKGYIDRKETRMSDNSTAVALAKSFSTLTKVKGAHGGGTNGTCSPLYL